MKATREEKIQALLEDVRIVDEKDAWIGTSHLKSLLDEKFEENYTHEHGIIIREIQTLGLIYFEIIPISHLLPPRVILKLEIEGIRALEFNGGYPAYVKWQNELEKQEEERRKGEVRASQKNQ